jgi:hypothetical protein
MERPQALASVSANDGDLPLATTPRRGCGWRAAKRSGCARTATTTRRCSTPPTCAGAISRDLASLSPRSRLSSRSSRRDLAAALRSEDEDEYGARFPDLFAAVDAGGKPHAALKGVRLYHGFQGAGEVRFPPAPPMISLSSRDLP